MVDTDITENSPYKVYFDEENQVMHGYVVGYHQDIPAEAIAISQKEFAEYSLQPQNYRVIEGVLTYVEPAEPTHEQKQKAKWEEVKAWRTKQEYSGIYYKGELIQTDEKSRDKIGEFTNKAQTSLFSNTEFNINWITASNIRIHLTGEEMVGMNDALANYDDWLYETTEQLREQINSAITEEELEAIKPPESPKVGENGQYDLVLEE